jgi:hypothetical protein
MYLSFFLARVCLDLQVRDRRGRSLPSSCRRAAGGRQMMRVRNEMSATMLLVLCSCAGAVALPRPATAVYPSSSSHSRSRSSSGTKPHNLPPELIAHRGDSIAYPENTLEAFMSAFVKGADVIETDVFLTADGIVVCIHDTTVTRTTEATGAVSSYTLAELQQLDAGYRWTRDGGATFPFRGTGVYVPTLREALERL